MVAQKSSMPRNGQRNLLVIVIQDLTSTEPVLESVWLLISFPRNGNLTLLPILPDPSGVHSEAQYELMYSFSLSSQDAPDVAFFEHLNHDFWWDNYILLDKVGISKILENFRLTSTFDTNAIFESIPSVWENPSKALSGQTELFRTICDQFKSVTNSDKKEILLNKIGDYILTDLDWSEFLAGWSSSRRWGYQFECEFPTLTLENK